MKTVPYHKLVRDKIPGIIALSGKDCSVETLTDTGYLTMLHAKLDEELAEYHESRELEELADLLEVIYAVAAACGSSREELESLRLEKREKRGGFEKKLLLTEVRET